MDDEQRLIDEAKAEMKEASERIFKDEVKVIFKNIAQNQAQIKVHQNNILVQQQKLKELKLDTEEQQ